MHYSHQILVMCLTNMPGMELQEPSYRAMLPLPVIA